MCYCTPEIRTPCCGATNCHPLTKASPPTVKETRDDELGYWKQRSVFWEKEYDKAAYKLLQVGETTWWDRLRYLFTHQSKDLLWVEKLKGRQ